MLGTNNNLTVGTAGNSVTYNFVNVLDNGTVKRINLAAPFELPQGLESSSQTVLSQGKKVQRVFVRFQSQIAPAFSGEADTGAVTGHIVFNVPIHANGAVTAESIRDRLISLMSAANLTALLRGDA